MKLDIIARDGSPLGVSLSTLQGDDPKQIGTGGSELAILTLCEAWHNAGHKVRFYNNPRMTPGPFEQLPTTAFDPDEDRDILIVFRSPNPLVNVAKGLKVWFSCDQYTEGSFAEFAPKVDKIVVISPFHANYFATRYGIMNTIIIDLPVRTWEYEKKIEKVPGRCIWTSIADRGLKRMLDAWPRIVQARPDASMIITADYRLWGNSLPLSERYMQRLIGMKNISMIGAVRRPQLVEEQLKAQLLVYPCLYEELFCYACAEAEVAGAWPITTSCGALPTTNMGTVFDGDYAEMTIKMLSEPQLPFMQQTIREKAMKRFNTERILDEWNKKVFN
jgi:glycosyltransferase involved in cell wall biosynthesis